MWKSIVLDIFVVIFAAAFGYLFSRFLAGNLSILFAFAALLGWCAMSVLEGFMQHSTRRRFPVIFLESVVLIAFFYAYTWQALLIAGVLVLVCLLWGYFAVRREMRNSITIRFFTASSKVVGKVITAAVIFMIVMYAALASNNGSFFISRNGFDAFFGWSAGFVNNFYPTLSLSGSFGDFAQAAARMQLESNPAYQNLSPEQQSAALAETSDQIMADFSPAPMTASDTAAQASLASEPTSNAFYAYFSNLFTRLQGHFNDLFVGAWGVILFLILRSIGIFVVWIGQFIALVFYELLLAVGFMRIKEEPATREVIEYD